MKVLLLVILATVGITYETVLIADSQMSNMIEISASKPYCTLYHDRGVIQAMLFDHEVIKVRRMEVPDVDALIKICRANKINPNQGGFIYPGTKWCGPGNIASSYDDLGTNIEEDKCCRAHDNCPQSLKSGECRPGICNDSPFTRSHCDCDAELRRCLQTINTDVSNTIGAIFFNVIQVTCIKERRPCSKWQSPKNASQTYEICTYQNSKSKKYIAPPPRPGTARAYLYNFKLKFKHLFKKFFKHFLFKNKLFNFG